MDRAYHNSELEVTSKNAKYTVVRSPLAYHHFKHKMAREAYNVCRYGVPKSLPIRKITVMDAKYSFKVKKQLEDIDHISVKSHTSCDDILYFNVSNVHCTITMLRSILDDGVILHFNYLHFLGWITVWHMAKMTDNYNEKICT